VHGQQVNRISGRVMVILSLTALLTVILGFTQPPQPDEGSLAHIFQLTIAALVLAFGALYYLEHCR
jgi:hypothetical protein